jgi:hypothetical protein
MRGSHGTLTAQQSNWQSDRFIVDDFCTRQFFATEAAFLAVVATFNLLSLFQTASGQGQYRQPASLRAQVFLCGAVLGRHGHEPVLYLSLSWGGLEARKPLREAMLR